MKKQISLSIKRGIIDVDYKNFAGNECEKMEERIGLTERQSSEIEMKPEYYNSSFEVDTESFDI